MRPVACSAGRWEACDSGGAEEKLADESREHEVPDRKLEGFVLIREDDGRHGTTEPPILRLISDMDPSVHDGQPRRHPATPPATFEDVYEVFLYVFPHLQPPPSPHSLTPPPCTLTPFHPSVSSTSSNPTTPTLAPPLPAACNTTGMATSDN